MKELNHPQVIQLREVFFGSRTVYLVMELCTGGELFEYLSHHASMGLSEASAAKYLREMLSAMAYLHSHNIMHRDLKLENFLFDGKGVDASLKLIDFGLSKHFNTHEVVHQMVGSAYYTAPEVLDGHYDQRCDVWSMGIIAYMLLTGSPPFYGDSSDEIHRMIRTGNADFGPKRFDHCSAVARDLVEQMLKKDPNDRISMADTMRHPFITNAPNSVESSDVERHGEMVGIVDSMQKFVKASHAKQTILKIIAFSLSPTQINTLRDEFLRIDMNHNGSIPVSELHKSVVSFSGVNVEHLDEHSDHIDVLSSIPDSLNYNEFIAAAMCERINIDEDRLHLAFEAMDEDKSGQISADSIRHMLGDDINEEILDEMFADMDHDKDGKIEYVEFLKYWRSIMIKYNVTPLQKFRKAVNKVRTSIKILKGLGGFKKKLSIGGQNATIPNIFEKSVADTDETPEVVSSDQNLSTTDEVGNGEAVRAPK